MMRGEFCNSTIHPLSCSTSNVYDSQKVTTNKPMMETAMTCKSNFEIFYVQEGVLILYSLDIANVVKELTITATNIRLNFTPSSNASGENDVKLLCFARYGATSLGSLYEYSSDLNKSHLVIHSPLIGRLYISIIPVDVTKKSRGTQHTDVKSG